MRQLRLIFISLTFLLPFVPSVHAAPSLWFSDSATLYQADLAASTLTRRLSMEVKTLAADSAGGAWILTSTELIRLDPAGVNQLVKTRESLALDGKVVLAADPWDGSLWLAMEKSLLHINAVGDTLLRLATPRKEDADTVAMAVGLDQSVWRLTKKSLTRYSAAGALLVEVSLDSLLAGDARHLALDPLNPIVWIAASDSDNDEDKEGEDEKDNASHPRALLRLDFSGTNMISLSVAAPSLRDIAFTPHNGDPQSGRLWVLSNHTLARYRADGALEATIDLKVLNLPSVRSLTSAPGSTTLWISHKKGVTALTAEGALLASLAADKAVKYADATLLHVAPTLTLVSPPDRLYTRNTLPTFMLGYGAHCNGQPCNLSSRQWAGYRLTATLNDLSVGERFTLNAATGQTAWVLSTPLAEGIYRFNAQAHDAFGHATNTVASALTIDITPPSFLDLRPPNGSAYTIASAKDSVNISLSGRLSEPGIISLGSIIKQGPDFSFPITLLPGANNISLFAVDDALNGTELKLTYPVQIAVPPPSNPLPPDPSLVATPVDKTVASILATTTAFLYTGSNPIQTGVAPGTIVPKRAAVLRGKVMSRDNTPLTGVKISVLNHPEFGQTLSRADGVFDMAVNGGGYLTLNYTKTGYLPAQRLLNTPWQDFAHADDVVMIALDSQVTPVNLGANTLQVAQGNPVTDADGTRTATILFPAGTQATMTLPDGSSQPLTTLNVRATEYTVGPNGPKAMPGALPPTSGYTYAVELSVDEAIAAGAKDVRFNQPVPVYVDNFLNFPVGGIVPAGYYDRTKAAWIPAPNGRVIKILGTAGGMAQIDANGDGVEDDAAQLAALSITAAERVQLATLYPVAGKTLWRVGVTHFTPWDYNWPFGPPPDATPPKQPKPKKDKPEDEPDCNDGSIIECQNQILGERLPVTGVPFSLNYRSDRVPGRKSNRIFIQQSSASVPASLRRIELVISVAGQQINQSFSATPNQSHIFEWDGKDAYGRDLQGNQTVNIRVGYVYGGVYQQPTQLTLTQSFGNSGNGIPITGSVVRQEVTLWQESSDSIGVPDARSQGLGGWTASIHHAYDQNGKTLFMGDGTRRSAASINNIITTVAGNGIFGFSGDSGAATAATLYEPYGATIDAQGNLFITDSVNNRIRKISPDGIISTVAGNGIFAYSGDGGAATVASLAFPTSVNSDARGNLFITDSGNHRIRKVSPDGIITTVAGNGTRGFSGDGGAATAASLNYPYGISSDAQGNLYFTTDYYNSRIRKVSPDGIITTVAGNGTRGFSGDGGIATSASLFGATGISSDAQGNLFFADSGNNRIRKVSPDGIISTVAGNGTSGFSGDGGIATSASLGSPEGVSSDAQGNLYIADSFNNRIRKVSPDGIISTVAGNSSLYSYSGDGGAATAASLFFPAAISGDPQGNQFIVDTFNYRIRKIAPPLPGFDGNDLLVPSANGTELYHFDPAGRHLRTLNTKTKAVVFSFAYNSAGRLIEITDGDNNKTLIERDSASQPTAIVSADQQRTTLALDANGYIAAVTNPAGEAYRMSYTADGLLARFADPRNNASLMTYDAQGRITRDQNAAGGFWALSRTELSNGYQAIMTSAQNRTTTYRVENLSTGDQRRTNRYPDGTQTINLIQTNGTTTFTAPDGTITTSVDGPDPRFGMQASLPTSAITKTPSGLTSTVTATRKATLSILNDPLSLVTQTDTITLNGKTATTVYDAALRQTTVTSPGNRKILMNNDAQGRVLHAQVASLEPVNYAYDTRGRLSGVTQGSGTTARSFSYAYGTDGNLANVTDVLGRTTLYQRDAAGRATQITLPGNRILGMRYDANGNPIAITPPARTDHAFTYSAVDLTEQITPPAVTGVIDPATRYAWSLDKDLTQTAYPDGSTLGFAYDAGGRLSSITPSVGAGSPLTYTYASNGKLASITTLDAALNFSYDGALPTQETLSGSISGSLSRAYNPDFQVNQLTLNAVATAYTYDTDGLLTGAGALALSRDPGHGALTGSTLGSLTTSQTYTAFGELDNYTATYASTPLLGSQFSYDLGGRITSKIETISGVASTTIYSYDLAGRLASTTQNGSTTTWDYDANGNRTHVNGTAIATVDAQDRLLSYGGTAYNYTANGSLSSKTDSATAQTTRYTYDALGNLKAVVFPGGGRIDYLVDGRNRRIGKKVNGTLIQGFIYQNQLRIAAELDGSNTVVARFTYGERPNVPELMVKGGTTYRILTDHLGSVRLVVDAATGVIAQRIDYDAWGQMTSDSRPGFQPFGYAGGLYDVDTRFTRFGARDYEAETGRWTAKDPIGFGGGDANLYSYVGGNPQSRIDPTGKIFFIPIIVGAVFEGGSASIIAGSALVLGGAGIWMANNLPPGYWPGDKGAEEWGRRDGCGAKEGKRRFHKGVKQGDPMSGPKDQYGVDPSNGNVVDPEGEIVGNLNGN